ncbi:unnamed protein product [Rhizoctonia solani]|uniref:Uncharacterized protein n=1 Tax=Rhizoctonia solani TaxID=456999 RepID=A0A8H3C2Y4_9AGAM|nr:unnamed protein product [Rhizoctonia solani]
MGKQAAAAPAHLAPAPQNLFRAAPNVPLGQASPTSSSSESSAPGALSEGYLRRNGNLGHPARSETSTPVSDWTSTYDYVITAWKPSNATSRTSPSPPLYSGVADIAPGVESSRAPTLPVLQDLTAASSLPSRTPSHHPPGAFPTEDAHALLITLKPLVRVCVLCTGAGVPVREDTDLILRSLDGVPNVDSERIIVRTTKEIGTALDEFFDPTGIPEGATLILIVSCHGSRGYRGDIELEFKTKGGSIVNSGMLQEKLLALPEHCTLEAVVDTCLAEGVIPGLRRISTMEPSAPNVMPAAVLSSPATHGPPSGSRRNTKVPAFSSSNTDPCASFPTAGPLKRVSPFFEGDRPHYKAQVVVWAASTISENVKSYPEEDLPDRPGMYSILIGAIFRHYSSSGPNITRREIWENVQKVVEEHNHARHERDSRKPREVQAGLIRENRVQRPTLLTSVDNPDCVLSGLVFQPIKRA